MIVIVLSLKIMSLVVTIFAFATTIGFKSSTSFLVKCNTTLRTYTFGYSYPFDLKTVGVSGPLCNKTGPRTFVDVGPGNVSSAQFYVCVGVMAFLYCITALIMYICFDDLYRKNTRIVIMDFIISVILTALLLISSSVWAQGVADVKYYTDPYESGYFDFFKDCETNMCSNKELGKFSALNVSIIFGFANFIVWAANLWFLYRETPWYKIRSKPPGSLGIISDVEPQMV